MLGVDPSGYDAVAVTITDANGNAVPGWTNRVFKSNELPLDISSIPFSGSTKELNVQMVISWGSHPVDPDAAVDATFVGDSVQICYQTKVGPQKCASAQDIKNTANAVTSVPGGTSDGPKGNNSETATLHMAADPDLCKWDLGITKKALDSPVVPGKNIRYQMVVTNYGPDAARNVKAVDRLPDGLTYVSSSKECENAKGIVTCELGQLASGATHSFEIIAHASKSLNHSVTNPVRVCSDKPGVGPDPSACDPPAACKSSTTCNDAQCRATGAADPHANDACASVRLAPRLVIKKIASKKRVAVGKVVVYRIRTTNPSTLTLRNVKTCDTLPRGLAYVGTKPKAKVTAGKYCWTLKRLGAHKSKTYKVRARALRGAPHKVVNHATATADNARAGKAKRTLRIDPGAGGLRGGGVTG